MHLPILDIQTIINKGAERETTTTWEDTLGTDPDHFVTIVRNHVIPRKGATNYMVTHRIQGSTKEKGLLPMCMEIKVRTTLKVKMEVTVKLRNMIELCRTLQRNSTTNSSAF